jgi:hypothetical protein
MQTSSLRLIEIANEFIINFKEKYLPNIKSLTSQPMVFFEKKNLIKVV